MKAMNFCDLNLNELIRSQQEKLMLFPPVDSKELSDFEHETVVGGNLYIDVFNELFRLNTISPCC